LFYGWVMVVVIAFGGFSASTEAFPVLSIFLKPITDEFGWSRAAFTAPLTIGGLLGSVVALMTGPLVDRYGSRWALAVAYGILGVTFGLMSQMNNLGDYYVLQIIARSMNTGVMSVATAVVIPNWFIVKRGKAFSLSNLGFPIGATLIPLYIGVMLSLADWRAAALGVGVVIIVISMLPTAVFLRRRPEDLGLTPDGLPDLRSHPERTQTTTRRVVSDVSITLRQAAREPAFYLLTIAGVFWWFGRAGLIFHLLPYLTDSGISQNTAILVLSLHSLAGAGGSLLAGFLRDRYGVRYILAADLAINATAVVLVLMVTSGTAALAWSLLYGVAQGGSVPLQRLMYADYFGRRHLGSIEGVVRAVQNIAQATGPLVAAFAFDAFQSYTTIFTVFIGTNLIAAVLVALARPPRHVREESAAEERVEG
jgi:sugar phosphate permease